MNILSVKDLSFSYDKKTSVLNRVSLEIQAGQ
jgi:ABC-type transport system involved in cytochrome bd biosynthesis fused ATPase/permease subunit